METIIVLMLIAKCLMDMYLKRFSIKNICVFALVSALEFRKTLRFLSLRFYLVLWI